MNKLTLSRGPGIDTEKCVENAGANRFNLVLIAAVRAREIKRQHKENPFARFEQVHTSITALEEIQAGTIDAKEYLKKVR